MVMVIGVAALGPPSPVAVTDAVKLPAAVGVPVIAPVLALIERPEGKPEAVHDVAGWMEASVRAGVWLNAVLRIPVKT